MNTAIVIIAIILSLAIVGTLIGLNIKLVIDVSEIRDTIEYDRADEINIKYISSLFIAGKISEEEYENRMEEMLDKRK